jgi:hypothetical protein
MIGGPNYDLLEYEPIPRAEDDFAPHFWASIESAVRSPCSSARKTEVEKGASARPKKRHLPKVHIMDHRTILPVWPSSNARAVVAG